MEPAGIEPATSQNSAPPGWNLADGVVGFWRSAVELRPHFKGAKIGLAGLRPAFPVNIQHEVRCFID